MSKWGISLWSPNIQFAGFTLFCFPHLQNTCDDFVVFKIDTRWPTTQVSMTSPQIIFLVNEMSNLGRFSHFFVQKKGKRLYVAFIDFSKFFDVINRDILKYKLLKYGITGKFYEVIKSYYAMARYVMAYVKHVCRP